MKTTPLNSTHIALGAKMVEFAGYNMPVSYSGITEEHQAVRRNVGVFDVCHMGEFIVRGKQALDLVQKVTSNDASKLAIGQAQYSCLPNSSGGIVDDLLVYRLPNEMGSEGEHVFMLVVNASNMEKDWDWISKHNTFDARMINISDETGLLAIQGPNAAKALQSLTDVRLDEIPYYHFTKGRFAGVDNIVISATGYTGAGGFELYTDAKNTAAIWDAIFEAGKSLGIKPIGLGARDTLRLEMGFCLYGNDIDDTTSPLEAGLGWITKIQKGDFIGKDWISKQKENGVSKKLVGFVVNDRRVPRHHYLIEDPAGNEIGHVTSGTQSPSMDKPIGMGYVSLPFSKPGATIMVVAGNKRLEASVVPLPIYQAK
ncbi:MAG: glycine cleavage system aminomethyltransferase GcvT [Saprospirales bacterium]|nr:glycine cleavage system aminomethyltransferase GcvT [Saprospirales bacterium]MBK6902740.1 glycine cleavage system aminomethyltransferase GcvT [Saprospirales bacterium]